MKTAGIIVEYNPFHNGHLYHLQRAREIAGADYIVAVMSGDFVRVKVTGAADYDLIGEIYDESAQ